MPPKKAAPWGKSKAKRLLSDDITSGAVTATMNPRDVYAMRPEEYGMYRFERFRANLSNLQTKVDGLKERAAEDAAALIHDRQLHPIDHNNPGFPYPRWDGSEAQRLLKMDMDTAEHKKMKPMVLNATRDEYKPFKAVFRDHIQQEVRRRRDAAYWLAKKNGQEDPKPKI
jgi:hypothetical protein